MILMTRLLTIATTALLVSCSATTITHDKYPPKKPQQVSFFTNQQTPASAYRVIGVAKVSKYTLLGARREDTTVDELMRTQAASIGGDGLIDKHATDRDVQARVIAYQKILL